MRVFGVWFYDELRHRIGEEDTRGKYRIILTTPHNETFSIKSLSTRLLLLKINPRCVKCKKIGALWLLEGVADERPHLNLYAINRRGSLALMTQDHILPLSKGGTNDMCNLQTMCGPCNFIKGNKINEAPNF